MDRISVMIAGDHQVIRASLRALIDDQVDLQVCGEAATGGDTLEKLAQLPAFNPLTMRTMWE